MEFRDSKSSKQYPIFVVELNLQDSQSGIIPQEGFFKVLEQGLISHSPMKRKF
jgi:hypothetical protein